MSPQSLVGSEDKKELKKEEGRECDNRPQGPNTGAFSG